jgi:PAS domain S-box-containing protein
MSRGRRHWRSEIFARLSTGRARAANEHVSATERALAESTERYRSLFAYNPHAAFSLDLHGRFIDANAVAERLSGYAHAELRSMSFVDVVCDEDLARTATAFEDVVNRHPQQLEARMVHKDGHVIDLSITSVPVVVGDEVVGVHGVAEDVTERNELRRALEQTQRVAEEASVAKSLFLANISHEVRTPLTSLLAATELLRETEMDAQQDRFAEMIVHSGTRLLRLVSDILDFSRIEAGKVDLQEDAVSLRAVVQEAVEWCVPVARQKGLAFTWSVDPELPEFLSGDAMRISQVLTNLLENAVKFTDAGEVLLAVEFAGVDEDCVQVRFLVKDSGVGIPADQLDTLFEAFTQGDGSTTRTHGGAGLGLAICHELVTLMGGSFAARSTSGSGSTFTFTLPLRKTR